MPCKKYYRCSLPTEVLQLIGNFAGDHLFKLEFTYSKVRGFLSTIKLTSRRNMYVPKTNLTLKRSVWHPIRLGNFAFLEKLVQSQNSLNLFLFKDNLQQIYKQLAEVQNYTLLVK